VIGPDLYSFRDLWWHYRQCRCNKRTTANALAFEVDAEANLLALQQELRAHSYRPGRSICFITDGPKPREVFAADFRDRVVHHLLVAYQERVFEPIFIHDSYACRKGKGTLAASDRLMRFLRQVTANSRRPAWALKLDVANFFPSIHKVTLYAILARHTKHPEALWLTHTLLFHDPTSHYRFQSRKGYMPGPESPHYPVPSAKSLFGKHNQRGLPIGNLTSQFWGNVYLNKLDHFVKRTLKCRYYLRYVDDMVLLGQDRKTLVQWVAAIEQFLRERLKLTLRPELTAPFPVGKGIDFVGWKTGWNRRLPRRRTLGNMRARLEAFERVAVQTVQSGMAQRVDLRRQDKARSVERLRAVLASYSGHLQHGTAWRTWEALWIKYPWLAALFVRAGWALEDRWSQRRIARMPSFQAQYWRLARHAGHDALVFFQVGRFVEFYGPQRTAAAQILALRTVALPRAGYAFTVGFPVHLSGLYTARALRQGLIVVEVRQGLVRRGGGCISRLPGAVVIPKIPPLDGPRRSFHRYVRLGLLPPDWAGPTHPLDGQRYSE
jgi:Mismatch repair ATPase (MutS family)